MILNDDELAVLESSMHRIAIFWRLDTDPVVRLWLGVGNIAPGVNVYDLTGEQYLGFGEVQNVPAYNQLINGRAVRVEFTVSGVSGYLLQIASSGYPQQVKGKRVAVGIGIMDEDWQLLGPVKWCANYEADYLSVAQSAEDETGSVIRSLTLSCGSIMTGRRRPGLSFFSDQDQRARVPGDKFCERTPLYASGFNKAWPTFPE